MRKHLENRHTLDIIVGIVSGAVLLGSAVAFVMLNHPRTPKMTMNTVYIAGIVGMFGFMYWLANCCLGRMRNYRFLSRNQLLDCGEDIDFKGNPTYWASKLFFGEHAVYSGTGKVMVPYEQIVWVYKGQHKTNGITDRRSLHLGTKAGHIAEIPLKEPDFSSEDLIRSLAQKLGPNTIYGYSMQNLQAYRKIVVKK